MTDDQIIAAAGEPVVRMIHRKSKSLQDSCRSVARTYEECSENAYPDDWVEGEKLYPAAAILSAVKPLRERIAELEAELSAEQEEVERINERGAFRRIQEISAKLAAADRRIAELDGIVDSMRDSAVDKIMSMTDDQVSALCRLEGSRPEDSARIAKQAMDLALSNTQLNAALEREKVLRDALDTTVKAIMIFRNEPALKNLHKLRSSEGYGVMQKAMDIGIEALALPNDDTALRQIVEDEREACEQALTIIPTDSEGYFLQDDCIEAIKARKKQ